MTGQDLILRRLDAMAAQQDAMRGDLTEVKDDQKIIKEQVARTNGRVTALEIKQAAREALSSWRGKLVGWGVSFLSGAGLVVVAFIFDHF